MCQKTAFEALKDGFLQTWLIVNPLQWCKWPASGWRLTVWKMLRLLQ